MADRPTFRVGQSVKLGSLGVGEIAELRPDGKLLVKIVASATGHRPADWPRPEYREVDAADVEPFD
jgi:hypothetical protein